MTTNQMGIDQLRRRVRALERALLFYADENNYTVKLGRGGTVVRDAVIIRDGGRLADYALEGDE